MRIPRANSGESLSICVSILVYVPRKSATDRAFFLSIQYGILAEAKNCQDAMTRTMSDTGYLIEPS